MKIGILESMPAREQPELVSSSVVPVLSQNSDAEIGVVKIDPALADTAAFCARYEISPEESANCVVIKGTRGAEVMYAACVILATTRADVNGLARRHLGAKKVSFAPMAEAVALTRMEYGGITPVGLPAGWPILIDSQVAASPRLIIGSGIRGSKLVVSGSFLQGLRGAVVLEKLGVIKSAPVSG